MSILWPNGRPSQQLLSSSWDMPVDRHNLQPGRHSRCITSHLGLLGKSNQVLSGPSVDHCNVGLATWTTRCIIIRIRRGFLRHCICDRILLHVINMAPGTPSLAALKYRTATAAFLLCSAACRPTAWPVFRARPSCFQGRYFLRLFCDKNRILRICHQSVNYRFARKCGIATLRFSGEGCSMHAGHWLVVLVLFQFCKFLDCIGRLGPVQMSGRLLFSSPTGVWRPACFRIRTFIIQPWFNGAAPLISAHAYWGLYLRTTYLDPSRSNCHIAP